MSLSLAEPSLKRSRDMTNDIESRNRPLKNEDFHALILNMMEGSNEHRGEAEMRVQDVEALLLVKFQNEVLPRIITGVQAKIIAEAKRGAAGTSASFKWNSVPYYSPEQGATYLDLTQNGDRTDMVVRALKEAFPKMEIQNSYSGPTIMWTASK